MPANSREGDLLFDREADVRAAQHEGQVIERGIETVFAEVLPGDKVDKIKELKSREKRVAMAGDGVNDAPALLTADVAVAIGAGTTSASKRAMWSWSERPERRAAIIALSRASYRTMMQNLWWAAGYNFVAIPLAAGVLATEGILLPPAFAAVLMSASTVIVAINVQLLRRRVELKSSGFIGGRLAGESGTLLFRPLPKISVQETVALSRFRSVF